jgi:antitoxin component of MazEF toxin-antitoxin module
MYTTTLKDCGDGTGDCYVELPDEIIKQFKLKEGDELDLTVTDGQVFIKPLNK